MNKEIERIPENNILFFDVESVRRSKELDPNSKEFGLYRWKIRDKTTNELPSVEETLEDYKVNAGLRFPYVKIVAISVGTIRDNKIIVKSLEGTEEEMLTELYSIMEQMTHVCGANILEWDLPLCRIRSSVYSPVLDTIPDRFNDSGKKPWNLGNIIDVFDLYKGTHRYNASLDEMCMLYGVESPKSEIMGHEVSNAYYEGKVKDIKEYCNRDVVSTINVFRVLMGRSVITDVTIRQPDDVAEEEHRSFLHRLYMRNELVGMEDEFLDLVKGKKLTKKDKEHLVTILEGVYIRTDFINNDNDSNDIVEIKKREIKELISRI